LEDQICSIIPTGRLAEARAIHKHAPDLAKQVEKGKRSNAARQANGACLQIPIHRGQSFRRIADSIPVIADSF
jgi:hypothetical protein